jgi:U3 small nucleolar RNA-associated protein 12
MVKAYLRYEAAASWGVIASAGGCAFDASGRLLATACLERVGLWSLKQGAEARARVAAGRSAACAASLTRSDLARR